MNDFIHSCHAAVTYPKNLVSPGEYQHILQSYIEHLDRNDKELFGVEDKAALDFWDLVDGATGTTHNCGIENGVFYQIS